MPSAGGGPEEPSADAIGMGGAADPSASRQAAELMALLGLSDDELCRILDADPLTLLSGQLEHRPELPILTTLVQEAYQQAGGSMLQRWVRGVGPSGRPLDALLRRDFAAFEDALAELRERGFVLRGGA
jgi:hypothetical protein